METLEQLKARIETAAPGARVEIIPNGSPASQPSLLLDHAHARAVAQFLRDDPALAFDYASNVTGVDWPEKTIKEKIKVKRMVEGVEKEVEELCGRVAFIREGRVIAEGSPDELKKKVEFKIARPTMEDVFLELTQ